MIVESVGIAVSSVDSGRKTALEDAMMLAVKKAQSEGVTDNNTIRERILEARDKILKGDV